MKKIMDLEKDRLQLLTEIKSVFSEVSLDGGITLHQSETIDLDYYPTEEAMAKARLKDTDKYWWEVKDEWIENSGVGGLSFLDGKGLRYYLPAYMSWFLRGGETSAVDSLIYTLCHDFTALFNREQKNTIAKFLLYVLNDPETSGDDQVKQGLAIWDNEEIFGVWVEKNLASRS